METKVNRNYKDGLFRFVFGNEIFRPDLLNLYNALSGSNHADPSELIINTIDDALYLAMRNDISFLIGSEMAMIEHQSTVNPNMPLRQMGYAFQAYCGYLDRNHLDIHSSALVKLPAPRCYVLYNGKRKTSDQLVLKLSDSFDSPADGYEWTSIMLNVNAGHNQNLMKQCQPLADYAEFIAMIRVNQKQGMDVEDAVDCAIAKMSKQDSKFSAFLRKHRSEVKGMSVFQVNQELHEQTLREEGREEGRKEGERQGVQNTLLSLVKDGLISAAEAAKRLSMSETEFRTLL